MVKIEHQIFVYYHLHLLQDMAFTGYVANHFETRKFKFARQKSALRIKQKKKKKSSFDKDKAFRALKMIPWSFSSHHIERRLVFFSLSNQIGRFSNLLSCS